MNGCIIVKTPIAVDYWRFNHGGNSNLIHFLSHMHSDHTNGLSSSWRRPIYCSEITGKLLNVKLNVSCRLVRVLEIGQPHIIPLSEGSTETMTVTLIDANHCPGAVMFLFQGYFGNILYTADFKYSPLMFTAPGLDTSPLIDVLYLDNTYNDPRCKWDSNEAAAKLIEDLIAPVINDANIVVALHNLGKEELLVQIAERFQRWIVVTPDRFETLQQLELPNVFTTDADASNIRVVTQPSITWKNLTHWNSHSKKTIVIVPTGLFMLSKKKSSYDHPNVYLVPYSCHSSYSELMEFVTKLCPKQIIPIVKDGGDTSDMRNFEDLLNKAKPIIFKMPESVRRYQTASNPHSFSFKFKAKGRGSHQLKRKQVSKRRIARGVVFEEEEENEAPALSEQNVLDDSAKCAHSPPGKKTRCSYSRSIEVIKATSRDLDNVIWTRDLQTKLNTKTWEEECNESKSLEKELTIGSDINRESNNNISENTKSTNLKALSSRPICMSVHKATVRNEIIIPVKDRLTFYQSYAKMESALKRSNTL
ncbi:5' exonuclease Apollo-like [Apostichopus japonicus]|uniref:5' exonuclease Apollo-like n=1 Tax=Stichopus japonicus TaxID=307972 RepID=UPI003AB3E4A1